MPKVQSWSVWLGTWPSGKLVFDCQKIAKNFHFFLKKLPMAIEKMKIFGNFFFWKICQIFGNVFSFKLQFSGGQNLKYQFVCLWDQNCGVPCVMNRQTDRHIQTYTHTHTYSTHTHTYTDRHTDEWADG